MIVSLDYANGIYYGEDSISTTAALTERDGACLRAVDYVEHSAALCY